MKRTKQSTFAKRERQEKGTGFAPVGGAQFTPGPWYAANMGNDFQGLVVEEQTGKNIAVAYDKRDVHILAAAPAMYDALQNLLEWAKGNREAREGNPYCKPEVRQALKVLASIQGKKDCLDAETAPQAEGRHPRKEETCK